ncbi:CapA family protein [Bacteroidota bacterium]
MKSRIRIFLYQIAIAVGYFLFSDLGVNEEKGSQGSDVHKQIDSISTLVINIVGDIMCHSVQFNYAKNNEDSFSFDGVFSEVKNIFSSDDFTIGNFETVLAGEKKRYSGFPYFNAPDEFLRAIKNAGFDLLITANNHSLDRGEFGLKRTIKKMNEIGINHTGTFLSKTERDSVRVYRINDIKLAVLAYTYGTNGLTVPDGKNFLINLIDFELINRDINIAKQLADIVLVYYHFGNEYVREPNVYQKDIVKNTIDAGADIIIGSHPHVIQPVEYFETNGGNIDSGIVAYSLGNFISNQRWRYSDAGVILQLQISRNIKTDSVYLNKVSFLPTWVFKGNTDNGREYIVLPSDLSYFDPTRYYLSGTDSSSMSQSYNDTKSIITRYTKSIQLAPIN